MSNHTESPTPSTRSRRAILGTLAASVSATVTLHAQAPTFREPSWPQQFTLQRGDRAGYGFVVGMAGAIVVNVTSSGQVAVALLKPNGSLAKNALGAGPVRIDYAATKEDIAAGEGWRVVLAEPSGAHAAPSATLPPPAASGSIAITHPPGDVRKIKLTTVRQPAGSPLAAQADNSLDTYRAAREAMVSAARAQRVRTVLMRVAAPAAALAQAGAPLPAARGATSPAATSTTKSATTGTGTAPAGSNAPASVASVPVVTSLDTAGGTPGDPVLVTGSGFGPAAGLEAHFIVGPGKDLPAAITYYNDGQIIVQVPDKDGIPQFAGHFYLRRGTNNSRLVSFRFDPKMDYTTLPMSNDRQVNGSTESLDDHYIGHFNNGYFCKDNDEFFLHTTLANGWVVDSAYVREQNHGGRGPWILGDPDAKGDAYVSVVSLGSNSPRIKVHWWCDQSFFASRVTEVRYWPVVVIRGPKGLPWQ